MTTYTVVLPRDPALVNGALLALQQCGLYTKPHLGWSPKADLLSLETTPAEVLAGKLKARRLAGDYSVQLDTLTGRHRVTNPQGTVYIVTPSAPVGRRCTCPSEQQRRYQSGRSTCKHLDLTNHLLASLGLLKPKPEPGRTRLPAEWSGDPNDLEDPFARPGDPDYGKLVR